jgi:hypothetical protein
VHEPTDNSIRPDTFPRFSRPRTRIAVPDRGVDAATKLPSGATRAREIVAVPICVVNSPGDTPGQSIGTNARNEPTCLPRRATFNRTDRDPTRPR